MTAWLDSPYYYLGIYIGGISRACTTQANLTPAWRTYVLTHGWGLMPLWVGPQLPCSGYVHKFSSVPATAQSQGAAEGAAALTALTNLGFPTTVQIVYDFEGTRNTIDAGCIAATQAFVQGWQDAIHNAGRTAGMYEAACNPPMNNFAAIARPPDFIWGADPTLNPSTSTISCTNPVYWTNSQRHKQYGIPIAHTEMHGGVTLAIDSDCANGPMYTLDYGVDPECL